METADIFPGLATPVALVSCADQSGKGNIITLAWVGVVCSEPPTISIAIRRGRHSYPLIKASGEFVLNVPTEAMVEEADYCGSVSGKTIDKWQNAGLTSIPATRVKAPLITQCPINMECLVRHILHLGTHDVFLGEVVAIHVDSEILKDGKLDSALMRPLTYHCREYWALGQEKLAERGVGLPKT